MNRVTRFTDPLLLARAAADLISRRSGEAIALQGRFTLALSGGKTPAALYQLLTKEPYCTAICWKKVFIFWVDERCVAADSMDNNSYTAKKLLLDHVPIPATNIFRIASELSPAIAAALYAQTLKDFFKTDLPRFDLILLGMGSNGHTASLFPNTAVLTEQEAIVKEVYVAELKMWRITFTATLINNAKEILFLVSGKEKTGMLNAVLEGNYLPHTYPAQLVRNAAWYIAS